MLRRPDPPLPDVGLQRLTERAATVAALRGNNSPFGLGETTTPSTQASYPPSSFLIALNGYLGLFALGDQLIPSWTTEYDDVPMEGDLEGEGEGDDFDPFTGPRASMIRSAPVGATGAEMVEHQHGFPDAAFPDPSSTAEDSDEELERALEETLMPPRVLLNGKLDYKVRHVVGRQPAYWATSRRHLLMRGRPHAELGIQTSISTRDYMATAISVTALCTQEEEVIRRTTIVEERTARCSMLLQYRAVLQHFIAHIQPHVILSVQEHQQRMLIAAAELKARERVFDHVCAQRLTQWAKRDRDDAKEQFEAAYNALYPDRSVGSASGFTNGKRGRALPG
jgi:hypothetical protein